MIHFVGAGSGAVDLITVRGQKLLEEADIVVYAGSLVNPELLTVLSEGLSDLQQCEDDAGRSDGSDDFRREAGRKKLSVCIPVIRVCMVRSKNRWICWKRRIFLIKCARESAPFAERHLH